MRTGEKKVMIETAELACILGISVKAARSFLKRHKLGRRDGRLYKVTVDQLVQFFPEFAPLLASRERPRRTASAYERP